MTKAPTQRQRGAPWRLDKSATSNFWVIRDCEGTNVACFTRKEDADAVMLVIAASPAPLDALIDTNELLLVQFGSLLDPDNQEGWSNEDAFNVYKRNCEVIALAEPQS